MKAPKGKLITTSEVLDHLRVILEPYNPSMRAMVLIVVQDSPAAPNAVNFDLCATAKPGTPKEVLESLIRYLGSMPDLKEKIESFGVGGNN